MILPLEVIETIFQYLDIEQIIDNYKILSDYFLQKKISCYPEFRPITFEQIVVYRKYRSFKSNDKIFDKHDHNGKMISDMVYGTPYEFEFEGNLWKNDSTIPLEEFNKLIGIGIPNIFDTQIIKHDEYLVHKQLLSRVLNQLQRKLNTLPKVTRTFNGTFNTSIPSSSFGSNKEPVCELTIIEYLEKYENFRNIDVDINIPQKKSNFFQNFMNNVFSGNFSTTINIPKELESLSCKNKKYKIESEKANLLRVIKDKTINFNKK